MLAPQQAYLVWLNFKSLASENQMIIISFTACGNDIESCCFLSIDIVMHAVDTILRAGDQYILRDMILKVKQWKNSLGKYKWQV